MGSSTFGDEDEHPLKLKLVKPRKRAAKKKEPVGVGAKKGDDDCGDDDSSDSDESDSN